MVFITKKFSCRPALFAACILATGALVSPALSQDNNGKPAAPAGNTLPPIANPGDDFVKQFADLKKQLEALGQQIKKSAGEIETLTSPDAARKEIGTLQGLIANTLGLVTNNGDVAKLGKKVIDYARAKRKQFENDTKFSPEDRDYLKKEWLRVATQTEAAIAELSKARSKLTSMLKTVQARGDFIEELQALKNANKMLEVVKKLADELRSASASLQTFSKTVKPPGAGM